MASFTLSFRPSAVNGRQGKIYFQISHNRVVRLLSTDYKIHKEEWNKKTKSICLSNEDSDKSNHLNHIKEQLEWDTERLKKVIQQLKAEQRSFTVNHIIAAFQELSKATSFRLFTLEIIEQLKQLGQPRTSETYATTLRSFMDFREGYDMPVNAISSDLMLLYESYLKRTEIRMNSVSFYLRILRAIYNRAVEKGLAEQCHPFRHVYTGVEKTIKRAVSVQTLKALKNLDLSDKPSWQFTRDIFLFSFYTRGMSFVDMAYLEKKNLKNGILTYCRRKTGQQLAIHWEKCMADIVAKYGNENSIYLLPIIKTTDNTCLQYKSSQRLMNYNLKRISERLKLQYPLTMYVARHSWASIAKNNNIPLAVISEGMGHDSETTTQIYLASLENSIIDKANKKIIDLL